VLDNSFKVLGSLRSNTGSVFFARTFDRNVDVGLDFVPQPLGPGKGFDNTPIIWGARKRCPTPAGSTASKLTLLVGDSGTGGLSERGRFYDAHLKIGNNIENFPGQSQQQFVNDQGSNTALWAVPASWCRRWASSTCTVCCFRTLNAASPRHWGLDVINVETSIASNYFSKLYMHQFDWNKWDYLTFANVGVTVGRYILYDKVFPQMANGTGAHRYGSAAAVRCRV